MSTEVKQSALKTCLEESDNPRMQKYVKILDTPNITAMEWIHRTQEELMDGIVYLEKLKNVFTVNMLELDAAARIVAERRAAQEADENGRTETTTTTTTDDEEDVEEININITVPMPEVKAPAPTPTPAPASAPTPAPKKRATKTKTKAKDESSETVDAPAEKEKKPVKKRKTKEEKA